MTYLVFQARDGQNVRHQVLINEDNYDGDPEDYFPAGMKDVRSIGKVEIDAGELDSKSELLDTFESA